MTVWQPYFLVDDRALAVKGAAIAGSPPQDTAFPASNLLHPDRHVLYRTPASPAGTIDIDMTMTMGAAGAVGGFGIHNLQSEAPAGSWPDVEVFAGFFAGSLASMGSIAGYQLEESPTRDVVTPYTGGLAGFTYWRLRFTTYGYRFSLGKFLNGEYLALGYFYSPGSEVRPSRPTTTASTFDKSAVEFVLGATRREYDLRFTEVIDQEARRLEAVHDDAYPIAFSDADSRGVHALPVRGGFRRRHMAGGDQGVWDVDLALRQIT